jgi:hypothetical protein
VIDSGGTSFGRGSPVTSRDRAIDRARASHPFDASLLEERCVLCGLAAAHIVVEQSGPMVVPMRSQLCCQHFAFAVDDCSRYPYVTPAPRR